MSNTTYMASRRTGGRANCAPDKRRVSTTISEEAFVALQARADASHLGLSGEAAKAIDEYVGLAAARTNRLHGVAINEDGDAV